MASQSRRPQAEWVVLRSFAVFCMELHHGNATLAEADLRSVVGELEISHVHRFLQDWYERWESGDHTLLDKHREGAPSKLPHLTNEKIAELLLQPVTEDGKSRPAYSVAEVSFWSWH